MRYKLILNGLDCAGCAAKIESKLSNTKGYDNVSLVFSTKTLSFDTENNNEIIKTVQKIVDKIESGITVAFADTSINTYSTDYSDKSSTTHSNNNSNPHGYTNSPNSDNKTIKKQRTVLLFSSIALLITAIIFEVFSLNETAVALMCAASVLLGGYDIIIKGFKAIFKLRLDETTLMTIAVIAAFFLGEYVEAGLVTVLFAIGEFFEDKAVDASRKKIEKLANIRPDKAILLKNDIETEIPAQNVKIGDTIIVKPYDRIPLDGIITNGCTYLDTSAITGESVPLSASVGTQVMSGMMNGEGLIKIDVTKSYENSCASRILKLVEDAAATKGQREKLITRFASIYTPIMLVLAVIIATVPPLLGLGDFNIWLYRSLVCLVASCPCSIVISVPLTYYAGIGAASKIGVLIKGGKYVEALARADSFMFDKTGTLTTGKLSVTNVTSYCEYKNDDILSIAASCEEYSNHPIAQAIKKSAKKADKFNTDNHTEKAGYGVIAKLNGKEISCTNSKYLSKTLLENANINDTVFVVFDNILIGSIAVTDTVRSESADVIKKLKKLGAKAAVMLTGDNENTANIIYKKLGLTSYYSELLPEDKVKKVEMQKQYSKGCVYIGDGINDAPVLAASNCGIAMGLGSEAAIEAADLVLTNGDLKRLPDAVILSRRVVNTVKANIAFSLLVKVLVIILASLGIAPMWLAVFADTGVSMLCVLNSIRLLK